MLAPYRGEGGLRRCRPVVHEGRRVVLGQRRMQVVSDILLGWTTVQDIAAPSWVAARTVATRPAGGLPSRSASSGTAREAWIRRQLAGDQMDDYARMTGALLARAHAHSADPRLLAGYCGKNEELDEALADFAVAYADRTEADHAELAEAVKSGRIAAEMGV